MVFSLGRMPISSASSMSGPVYSPTLHICINGGSDSIANRLFNNQGPSNVEWANTIAIYLDGGDAFQYVYWYYYMADLSSGYDVASWALSHTRWYESSTGSNGGGYQSNTLTAQIGGNMLLGLDLYNPDSVYQCFYTYATAFYT